MICDLQRASMWKRISAFLFDVILLSILAVLTAFILSAALGYDAHLNTYTVAYERYAAEFGVTDDMIGAASDGTISEADAEILNAASAAMSADPETLAAFEMVANLTTLIVTFSLLTGFVVLEFIVPLLLKNGQTLGKKIFGVAVMHVNGVRIRHVAMFVRTVLGKYAVETMPIAMCLIFLLTGFGMPVFFLIGGVLLIVQAALLIFTHEHALLHDKMAATVTVDLASQMIFETEDELLEYKKQLHAQTVADQDW